MADRWHLFLLWQLACCFVPYAIWWSQRAQCCYPDTGGRVEFIQDSNFSFGIKKGILNFQTWQKNQIFFSCKHLNLKALNILKTFINVCLAEKLTKHSSNTVLCLVSFSVEQMLDLPIIWITNRNTTLLLFVSAFPPIYLHLIFQFSSLKHPV